MYEWLRGVVPPALFNKQPTIDVIGKYEDFKQRLHTVNGTAGDGRPSHEETREIMYQVCTDAGGWDWRETRMGKDEFPVVPLSLKSKAKQNTHSAA
jgi:hypothetical protein